MKTFISFLLLVLMVTSSKAQPKTTIIALNEIRGKSHVTIKIGTVEIPDILLDTGFAFDGIMIYNPDYKDSLDLSNAVDIKIGGAGSGDAAKAAMIDSADFYLDDIKMSNQKIIALQGDLYKGFPSNGIIGYSIFGHYITEFDYDNNLMILHDSVQTNLDNSWSIIPLYFKNNKIPWLDAAVVIKDEPPIVLSMYIDYAAGDAVLLLEKSGMKFNLPDKTNKVLLGRGLSGDIYGKTGPINKLILGPYELTNVKAAFANAKVRSKQENADAVLGIGALRRFNLIFDYACKKLYLKPNKHFNDPYN